MQLLNMPIHICGKIIQQYRDAGYDSKNESFSSLEHLNPCASNVFVHIRIKSKNDGTESLQNILPIKLPAKKQNSKKSGETRSFSMSRMIEPFFCNRFMVESANLDALEIIERIAVRKMIKVFSTLYLSIPLLANEISISSHLSTPVVLSIILGILGMIMRSREELDHCNKDSLYFVLNAALKLETFIFLTIFSLFYYDIHEFWPLLTGMTIDVVFGYYINRIATNK